MLVECIVCVVIFIVDSLIYLFDLLGCYGLIDFDGGGCLIVEFVDVDVVDFFVGCEMCMVFCIKVIDV